MSVHASRHSVRKTSDRSRAKYSLFAVLGLMALFVLWNNEAFLLNPDAPEWTHLNPIRWQLIPHGAGGAIALFLGATQFSTRLRRRFTSVHRAIGKLYIGAAFVAGGRDLDGVHQQPVVPCPPGWTPSSW